LTFSCKEKICFQYLIRGFKVKNIFWCNIVDIINRRVFPGAIKVKNGKIIKITENNEVYDNFIMPGFIDAHLHIESSMLIPTEFAKIAVKHGTVAAVCDAHEIANVLGIEGIKFMVDNAKNVPLKFYFSAPSGVPTTTFETNGATISAIEVETLFQNLPQIKILGEVMNYPAVINENPEILTKIIIAHKYGKLIDGHAPGLSGKDLQKYASYGISTDHECFTQKEALEKINLGMKIQIREGSAVKNFDELIPIANEHVANCMLCSDDKHPDDLVKGHINELVKRGLKAGIGLFKILQIACVNPVLHYNLDVGLLRENDFADFLIIDNLTDFNILQTVINGNIVDENAKTIFTCQPTELINKFYTEPKIITDFEVAKNSNKIDVIEAIDGQLLTSKLKVSPKIINNKIVADTENDILKIAVVNRYKNEKPTVAFIKNFGLKKGAIASSVAHDSHNIVAVGTTDKELCDAVNLIIKNKGGICVISRNESNILPLPIAGLMSDKPFLFVAEKYTELDALAKEFGSKLTAPFMTLSFMALLVIPELKISDKGLFDCVNFELIKR